MTEIDHEISSHNDPAYQQLLSMYSTLFKYSHLLESSLAALQESEELTSNQSLRRRKAENDLILHLQNHEKVIEKQITKFFNPYFGSVFHTFLYSTLPFLSPSATRFAWNIYRYSDVYTSRVENLLNYPFDQKFPNQRILTAFPAM